jgi:hypothetical protein
MFPLSNFLKLNKKLLCTFLLGMRRTRKHNKKFNKTRRGGSRENLKLLPPLPESPPGSPKRLSNTKKPEIKVENKNLEPVKKFTHNWYQRQNPSAIIKEVSKPPLWKRLLGIKNMSLKSIPLNSTGNPIKSAFNINKNRGFEVQSKS